jgi:adenylate cyclase
MLELDLILVVGKTKPVRIFFLLGDESVRATSAFAALESAHDAMIRAYRRKDWTTALSELESCRSQAPEIVQFVYQLYDSGSPICRPRRRRPIGTAFLRH